MEWIFLKPRNGLKLHEYHLWEFTVVNMEFTAVNSLHAQNLIHLVRLGQSHVIPIIFPSLGMSFGHHLTHFYEFTALELFLGDLWP